MHEVRHLDDEGPGSQNSLSDKIYARLRHALMIGFYEPGIKISIRSLAAAYQISPTPVREAVFQLIREGALELKLGHQPRVPVLTLERYIEIRETRAPLERLAAELAAVRITPTEIAELRELHAAYLAAEARDGWKDALSLNQRFHFIICNAAGNATLLRTIENLWLLVGPFINNLYPRPEHFVRAVHPHLQLIDALERGSPAEAGDMAVRDLREGSITILERLKVGTEHTLASPALKRARK